MTKQPHYLRISEVLRERIVSGTYPAGSQLPTEEALSGEFAVSRNTLRAALQSLRQSKLISSNRKAGTTVSLPGAQRTHPIHTTSIDELATYASSGKFFPEFSEFRPLPDEIGAYARRPDENWLYLRGHGKVDNVPNTKALVAIYIDAKFAAASRFIGVSDGPVFRLIEKVFGETVIEVEQDITARAADRETARWLGVKTNHVVVDFTRVYRNISGEIVQITIDTRPYEDFKYSMKLQKREELHGGQGTGF